MNELWGSGRGHGFPPTFCVPNRSWIVFPPLPQIVSICLCSALLRALGQGPVWASTMVRLASGFQSSVTGWGGTWTKGQKSQGSGCQFLASFPVGSLWVGCVPRPKVVTAPRGPPSFRSLPLGPRHPKGGDDCPHS